MYILPFCVCIPLRPHVLQCPTHSNHHCTLYSYLASRTCSTNTIRKHITHLHHSIITPSPCHTPSSYHHTLLTPTPWLHHCGFLSIHLLCGLSKRHVVLLQAQTHTQVREQVRVKVQTKRRKWILMNTYWHKVWACKVTYHSWRGADPHVTNKR